MKRLLGGLGFSPAKLKTGPHGLGFDSGCVILSTGSAEGVGGRVTLLSYCWGAAFVCASEAGHLVWKIKKRAIRAQFQYGVCK
jgi:hypothetical protein